MRRNNDGSTSLGSSRPQSLTFSRLTANGKWANCKLNVAWQRTAGWETEAKVEQVCMGEKERFAWAASFLESSWSVDNLWRFVSGKHGLSGRFSCSLVDQRVRRRWTCNKALFYLQRVFLFPSPSWQIQRILDGVLPSLFLSPHLNPCRPVVTKHHTQTH